MKKHEDSDALILRLFETYGQRDHVTLTLAKTPTAVSACDMMEENDMPLLVKGNQVRLYFTPYEIKTLKVEF